VLKLLSALKNYKQRTRESGFFVLKRLVRLNWLANADRLIWSRV
jgi:hypothetical protein